MQENFYQCPYCWSQVSILVDLSIPEQSYIEDCERCCNPVQFLIEIVKQEITFFDAQSIEQ
jgi:transcription elongation factor Elf1